jgi:hypothetical protein
MQSGHFPQIPVLSSLSTPWLAGTNSTEQEAAQSALKPSLEKQRHPPVFSPLFFRKTYYI